METHTYDGMGKIDLSGIYDRSDPRAYFAALSQLDYCIPQEARPVFAKMIAARRKARGKRAAKVIDIGCSFGVNAALLKHGLTMDDLYRLYDASDDASRTDLIERDRRVFSDPVDKALEIVGLDVAPNAIDYGLDAGVLDSGLAANFETRDPQPSEVETIADPDLIISTGCFGYITDTSLERLLEASNGSRPWMAHFVLRMFPFDDAQEMLTRHGYVIEKLDGLYPQRRFASADERMCVLDNLERLSIDPGGAEDQGWYFADLFVARPEEDAHALPTEQILTPA